MLSVNDSHNHLRRWLYCDTRLRDDTSFLPSILPISPYSFILYIFARLWFPSNSCSREHPPGSLGLISPLSLVPCLPQSVLRHCRRTFFGSISKYLLSSYCWGYVVNDTQILPSRTQLWWGPQFIRVSPPLHGGWPSSRPK